MSDYDYLLRKFRREPGASEEQIRQASEELGLELPADYMAFMRQCDGGSGIIGAHYVVLWGVEGLAEENREYEADINTPELLLIADDGGGEFFAFDKRITPWPVVMVSMIGMNLDPYIFKAPTFDAFLRLPEEDEDSE